ncbi:tetratricopeptide repeat protein 16-like [Saccoglossus kowalevskii]
MSAKSVTFAEDSHEKRDIVEEEDEDKQSVGYEKYVLEADKKERDAELDTNDDKKEQDAEGDTNNEAQVDEIKPEVPSTGLFQTAVSEEKIEEAKQRNISTVGTEAMAVDLWGRELVPAESMQQVIENRAAEHYEKALQLQERGKHYKAILSFDKAINLQSRKVEYYINRGESYLQVCDFQSAILNYKKACVLDPENDDHYSKLAFIYFFHGQTLFDQHKFSDALESFSRAAEMKPEIVGYHTRSVACLAALQRHGECLALVNKRLEVERENPDLYIMRARLHELFRNTTLCYYDLKDALQLDPNQEEALIMMGKMEMKANEYKKQAIQMNLGGKYKESLQKVSMAIETNPTVPEYHVLRGALHRRLQDFNSAIDDYLLALDKTDHDEEHPTYQDAQRQLLLTYNDFAVECFSKEFYDEAIILLNKAIKGEKREKGLYINRGDCFFRQNALQFALADYHQALELDSSDSWIRARIANIHNEFGLQDYEERSFQEAEARFTVAIQHNPRIAQYYVSRSKARFMMENLGGSRTDLLMGLHLEPGNDEIMSLLPRLFPGKTVGDVMKSKAARAAKLTVENAVVMASPVKLPTLERTSEDGDDETELKDEKGAPSTAVPSTAYSYQTTYKPGFPDLKACMDEMEFHRHIVKGKKRITQKVKKMLYGSSTLKNDRPRLAPQPPARPVAVRGGALGSQGMVSVVNNGAKPQQAGWRSFSLGISPS